MKLSWLLSCVFVFSTVLMSCDKQSDPEICLKDVCIGGEWIWQESYGSIAGTTITPETEMQTRKLIITDSHYQEFVNDSMILETEYDYLITDELSTFTEDSLVLKLTSGNWYAVFEEDEKLILFEPCADCWEHTYCKE